MLNLHSKIRERNSQRRTMHCVIHPRRGQKTSQICVFHNEYEYVDFAIIIISVNFAAVFALSMTWNDLFCKTSWQIFNFSFLHPNRWYQFKSRINRIHFTGITTWNNYWETIAETIGYITSPLLSSPKLRTT